MKKLSINEEVVKLRKIMGITEVFANEETIEELSPSDIVNSMREDDMGENEEIKDKFKDEYGDKKGEEVYYATANKQGRDPETFEKTDTINELEPNVTEESFEYEEGLSDCCGAPIIMGDICDACGEHCEPEVYDEEDEESEVDEESAIGGWDLAMENIDEIEKELEEEEGSWMAMRAGKDGKIFEARAYAQETYFDTQSGALESAEDYALNRGYEADMTSFYPEHVKYGETISYHIDLLKNGQPVKNKMLHISLYRMESGKYELTNYIN